MPEAGDRGQNAHHFSMERGVSVILKGSALYQGSPCGVVVGSDPQYLNKK
jgi:hypothetical protein